MMIKDHPCKKDCPERSPVCQASCDRLKEYREKKREERRRKDVEFRIDSYQIDSINKHNKGRKSWK